MVDCQYGAVYFILILSHFYTVIFLSLLILNQANHDYFDRISVETPMLEVWS